METIETIERLKLIEGTCGFVETCDYECERCHEAIRLAVKALEEEGCYDSRNDIGAY